MAKKRMFSTTIVEDDVFLDMPLTSQSLYFHLGMNADDDGFVSPKRIMRMIGASEDDLKILVAKRYILQFESGVVAVKHWNINNTLKKDRYRSTTYRHEIDTLTTNDWGAYTEILKMTTETQESTGVGNNTETNRNHSGNISEPQYSIGKVSIGKVTNTSISNNADLQQSSKPQTMRIPTEIIDTILQYWETKVGYAISNENANRKAIAALIRQHNEDKLKRLIDGVVLSHQDKFAPRISDFVSLKRKQNDLMVWGKKCVNKSNTKIGVVR